MPALPAVFIIVLFEAICFTMTLPVISFYVQEQGGHGMWVGWLFLLMSGPKVFTNPFWGWFSDRFGRRPTLAINTVGTLSGSVCWALAPMLGGFGFSALGWLGVSRLLLGLFGGQAPLAQAVAADISAPHKRAAVMGVLGAGFATALTLGPLTAGWLVDGGWLGYAQLGWLLACLQGCSLIVILFLLPETRRAEIEPLAPEGAEKRTEDHKVWIAPVPVARALLMRGDVLLLLLITLVASLGMSQVNVSLPLVAEHQYNFGPKQTGYAFAVLGLIAALVQGGALRMILRRIDDRGAALFGLLIGAGGFGLFATEPGAIGFWSSIGLIAIGIAMVVPCLTGMLSRCVEASRQGALMGLNQATIGLGRAGGHFFGGMLYELIEPHGPAAPYGMSVGLFLIALVMVILFVAPKPSEAEPQGEAVEQSAADTA